MEFLSSYATEILAFFSNFITAYIAYRRGKAKGQ